MAKKTQKKTQTAQELAESLGEVRRTIAALKEEDVSLTAAFKAALHAEQITEAGAYQLSVKRTLKVADEAKAALWAAAHGCLKVDTSKAKEILRHEFTDPISYGFAVVESESIIPKGRHEE